MLLLFAFCINHVNLHKDFSLFEHLGLRLISFYGHISLFLCLSRLSVISTQRVTAKMTCRCLSLQPPTILMICNTSPKIICILPLLHISGELIYNHNTLNMATCNLATVSSISSAYSLYFMILSSTASANLWYPMYRNWVFNRLACSIKHSSGR